MRPIDADALIEFCAERWIPLNIDAVNMQPTIQPEKAQLSREGTTSDQPVATDTNVGDTISRQAAIRWVKTECNPYGKPTLDFESGKKVIEHLRQMPPAQPEVIACGNGELVAKPEPKEGRWINGKCDLCGEHAPFWAMASTYHESNYCPNCGARMKGATT